MNGYEKIVTTFAALGGRLIQQVPATRYDGKAPIGSRLLEPGFIPTETAARIVVLSYYPNETDLDLPGSAAYAMRRHFFEEWGRTGGVEEYRNAYEDWLECLPRIPFYRNWNAPVFRQLGIDDREFAWIPFVKIPMPARSKPDEYVMFKDGMDVWDQLELLKPAVLWVQGERTIEKVRRLAEGKALLARTAIVEQKLAQGAPTAAEVELIVSKLRTALQ